MNDVSKNVDEMIIQCVEHLESLGYNKHSIWGNLYNDFSRFSHYMKSKGYNEYVPELVQEYIQHTYDRYLKGELTRGTYYTIQRAGRKLEEFYETGTVTMDTIKRGTRFGLCEEFERLRIGFLESKMFHPNTKEDFSWAIRKYLFYLQTHGISSLADATVEDARKFVLETSTTLKAGSLHNILCYLKQFHVYLISAGEKAPDCIELFSMPVKREYHLKGYINDEELKRILEQVEKPSKHSKRDKAIIMLSVTTGLRGIDIINLKLSDIDWRKGEIKITQKKTGNVVILPLLTSVGELIKDYILNERKPSEAKEVFLRTVVPYTAISNVTSMGVLFYKYLKNAGIEREPFDGKTFHGLRRRLGRSLLVSGSSLSVVSQILGHQDTESAKHYISLDSENLKECALSFKGIEVTRRGLV